MRDIFPKAVFLAFCVALYGNVVWGQTLNIDVAVNGPATPISPYIYGANDWSNSADIPFTSARSGGNRLTAYNWETNASNAGSDYQQNSDNYLVQGFSTADQKIPGQVVLNFQKTFGARKEYTLATVPAAGYVAADMNGPVLTTEVAPSPRWKKITAEKPGGLSLTPNASDSEVYTDEFVNAMVNKLGNASSGGVNAWSIDNEPGLWHYTHPRIYPNALTVSDLISKSVAAAKAVKKIDGAAEIYGPATYGWGEMMAQEGADWKNTLSKQYDWFISAYLALMKSEGDKAGKRLLDVLDFHWYPESQGDCRIIASTDCDQLSTAQTEARMQSPRSLWDSTYVEKSWIIDSNGKKAIQLLNRVKKSIKDQYPGTKIAMTEYEYGGHDHYSGGLAQADVLGILGIQGVYMSTIWATPGKFSRSGFLIYLNYDGQGGKYGDLAVPAIASDNAALSTYAALDSKDSTSLHLIAINKKTSVQEVQFNLNGYKYTGGKVYGFDEASNGSLTSRQAVSGNTPNSFTYSLPAHSVLHFILKGTVVGVAIFERAKSFVHPYFQLSGRNLVLSRPIGQGDDLEYRLIGWKGEVSARQVLKAGQSQGTIRSLPAGQYILSVSHAGQRVQVSPLTVN